MKRREEKRSEVKWSEGEGGGGVGWSEAKRSEVKAKRSEGRKRERKEEIIEKRDKKRTTTKSPSPVYDFF